MQEATIKSVFDATTCADNLTKAERSLLLYAESCAVDRRGVLDNARMNSADLQILAKFDGVLLDYVISQCGVVMLPAGWEVVGLLRRRRAEQSDMFKVFGNG